MNRTVKIIASASTLILVASGVAAAQPIAPAGVTPAEAAPVICSAVAAAPQALNIGLQLPDFQANG